MSVSDLLSVTAELDAPRIFERSIKLSDGHLAEDRGLVSMDKRALYPGPRNTLIEVCAALGCPDSSALHPHLKQASAVHFGADGDIGKCYLEFPPDAAPMPHLVFLAIKWRGDDVRLNHYTGIAHKPHSDKKALVDSLIPDGPVQTTTHACLSLARDGDPDNEAVVLHVTEAGSARASIDISVADAQRSISDAATLLNPLFDAFGLDGKAFFKTSGAARFGHIAAGSDRKGAPFATLYYGAKEL
ncbi:hypothetical protein QTO30_13480 [Yoonia sp. GPGPB17]|uniref:hypothetical protein n=1 Tax=Yoonia sp. GPGPB17 TaxID=3026147 RepID=UPI0030C326BD